MKKINLTEGYTMPEITVLEVKVEHGFEGSTGTFNPEEEI